MADEKGGNSAEGGDRPVFANASVFTAARTGISRDESTSVYNAWASAGTYDEDMSDANYQGAQAASETITELFSTNREHVLVLDIACGTGIVGEKLQQQGFRKLQGLDPSPAMLDVASQKQVYEKLYPGYLDSNPLPMEDDIYDCAVISGGMCEGHIPTSGLRSVVRVLKPGGAMVIVMREDFLTEVAEYKDRLEKEMEDMEKEGLWLRVSKKRLPNYFYHYDGVVFIFRKC